jgi:hypothetical protein
MKSAVDKPAGALSDQRLIQQILDDGQADVASLYRPLIGEPLVLVCSKEGYASPASYICCGLYSKKMLEGLLRCR